MHGMDMGVWVTMMAAMMLPGAAPAVARRARLTGKVRAAPLFTGSYLAIWALAGVVAYSLDRPHGSLAAGAVVIAAGAYELTARSSGTSASAAVRMPAPCRVLAPGWGSGYAAPARASG